MKPTPDLLAMLLASMHARRTDIDSLLDKVRKRHWIQFCEHKPEELAVHWSSEGLVRLNRASVVVQVQNRWSLLMRIAPVLGLLPNAILDRFVLVGIDTLTAPEELILAAFAMSLGSPCPGWSFAAFNRWNREAIELPQ